MIIFIIAALGLMALIVIPVLVAVASVGICLNTGIGAVLMVGGIVAIWDWLKKIYKEQRQKRKSNN